MGTLLAGKFTAKTERPSMDSLRAWATSHQGKAFPLLSRYLPGRCVIMDFPVRPAAAGRGGPWRSRDSRSSWGG